LHPAATPQGGQAFTERALAPSAVPAPLGGRAR